MMRPKAVGVFYNARTDAVCVQGAALDACGKLEKKRGQQFCNFKKMKETFPDSNAIVDFCDMPDCIRLFVKKEFVTWSIRIVSAALNNETDWTREQIADWVEQMEDKYCSHVEHPTMSNVEACDETRLTIS